jgi:hypothetical protein
MPVTDIHINQTKKEILSQLLEMSEALLQGDHSKRIIADFDDDIIAKIANNFNRFADKVQLNTINEGDNQENLVNNFIEVISSFANLDFKKKLPISDNGTIMDAIATGINVLGDELEHSTASKQELEIEFCGLRSARSTSCPDRWSARHGWYCCRSRWWRGCAGAMNASASCRPEIVAAQQICSKPFASDL